MTRLGRGCRTAIPVVAAGLVLAACGGDDDAGADADDPKDYTCHDYTQGGGKDKALERAVFAEAKRQDPEITEDDEPFAKITLDQLCGGGTVAAKYASLKPQDKPYQEAVDGIVRVAPAP